MPRSAVAVERISFRPAADFGRENLAGFWLLAYEGYFVPISFTAAQLADHVRQSGIDLGRSVVALSAGEPAGISLAAIERRHGWIGGFGVAPKFRRLGVGARMATRQCEIFDSCGVIMTRLEVIAANPARHLYRAAGFVETRTLSTFEVRLTQDGGSTLEQLDPVDFAAAHRDLHGVSPVTWRRSPEAVSRALVAGGATFLGVRLSDSVASAVVRETLSHVAAVDATAGDGVAADRLYEGLGRRYGAVQLRIADERPDPAIAEAAARLSSTPIVTQFEMSRRCRPPAETAASRRGSGSALGSAIFPKS